MKKVRRSNIRSPPYPCPYPHRGLSLAHHSASTPTPATYVSFIHHDPLCLDRFPSLFLFPSQVRLPPPLLIRLHAQQHSKSSSPNNAPFPPPFRLLNDLSFFFDILFFRVVMSSAHLHLRSPRWMNRRRASVPSPQPQTSVETADVTVISSLDFFFGIPWS
ncbi:hypothetical protein PM082_023721 [Marasmius tenuissimus]|nr:hypothetical protein PM082_023721 [Marasmius tenuissimus]